MKKNFWIILFIIVLIADIIGIQTGNEALQFIFKPLIVPVLLGYFITATTNIKSKLKKWIVIALIFSWGGDVLLMFQGQKDIFFLLGLSSFLLAHIFYIIFFHHVRLSEGVKSNIWILLLVVIYYASLIAWLSPYLGDMTLPVRIYGVVISFMLMLALHMLFIQDKLAARWMIIGALLFVISDSVLAVNKFYESFELSGFAIMITYGLAQLFITIGAMKYIRIKKILEH